MAKAKKPARRAPKAAAAVAEQPPAITGRKFAVLRTVTIPVLALKIEAPAYVTFRAEPRKNGDDGFLAEVLELETRSVMDLEVPAKLSQAFIASYPGGDVMGKSFCIVRHAAHARKNRYGYTIEEIDPGQPTESTAAT
jgi:hypothetical protein